MGVGCVWRGDRSILLFGHPSLYRRSRKHALDPRTSRPAAQSLRQASLATRHPLTRASCQRRSRGADRFYASFDDSPMWLV